jgi:hypothetical protein
MPEFGHFYLVSDEFLNSLLRNVKVTRVKKSVELRPKQSHRVGV